jgi:hypothetical protein
VQKYALIAAFSVVFCVSHRETALLRALLSMTIVADKYSRRQRKTMEDHLEFAYPTAWDESQTDAMKGWLATAWMSLDGEEPEADFLEYVMVSGLSSVLNSG